MTPFMAAAQSGDVSTVKYFLDHGGDLMKSDEKGRTVLHYAVCTGCYLTIAHIHFFIAKDVAVSDNGVLKQHCENTFNKPADDICHLIF
jgi:hypothetical protein